MSDRKFTITKFAEKKPMIQLDGQWFGVTSKVKEVLKSFSIGDVIEPTIKDGENGAFITFIPGGKKSGNSEYGRSYNNKGKSYSNNKSSYSKSSYGKSPEEQEAIRRMSVLSSVATIVASLDGVDLANVAEVSVGLYKDLYAVVTDKTASSSEEGVESYDEAEGQDPDFDGEPAY